jgi:serine protease
MPGRSLVVAGCAVVFALASASSATAAPQTYCVHQGGACAVGQVDVGSDLQTALNDAVVNPGSTVLIGPGTFTHAGGFAATPSVAVDMTITGAGAGRTVIEATGSSPVFVFQLRATTASTLSGVTVGITSNVSGYGLILDGATANGIAVTLEPGAGLAYGAQVLGGATIEHSTIQGGNVAVLANISPATLLDDTLSAPTGISSGGTTLTGQDLRITGANVAVAADGATDSTTIDGLLAIVNTGASQSAVQANNGATLVVRSATLVDVGTAAATGVFAAGVGAHTSLTFSDSIVRGFTTANGRAASGGAGAADLTLNNDDIALVTNTGVTGTFTHTGDIDADPLFVNPAAGDYRLRFGSPAIDTGGNCAAICQTVPDLDGLVRPIDGNGDGTAVRDMGAFEYGHRAPTARAAGTSAAVGQPVTFDASGSSDPDDGDALSYAWTFDDGSTATGPVASHAFATPGAHTGIVTVSDPSGLTATAAAGVTVAAVKDITAPAISSLKLSHSTFAVAKGSTATVATAAATSKTHPKGTTIRFRLSEAAKATFAIARRTHGIKVGKSCVAPSKKHKRGKACTRYVKVGSLTRRSERVGADSLAFTGRLGHKALHTGHYRLTLTATDSSGNVSKAKTASFTIVSR